MIKAYISDNQIVFNLSEPDRLAYTEYDEKLWEKIKDINWTIQKNKKGEPKYLVSGKLKKSLHQLVIENYFGAETLKEAYKTGMIIEHLNNDGFDCKISNLYFLKKIRNTYKGMHFDKESEKAIPILAMRIFHIIENGTFQMTIGFNAKAKEINSGRPIQSIRFLYKCDYWMVIQDAEMILEKFLSNIKFDLSNSDRIYRYVKYELEYAPEAILTEEEAMAGLKPGNIIWRNGEPLFLTGDTNRFRIISVSPKKDWDL
ncbi:hypothetical protein SAMN02745134_00340 [Clostridium acidisoli DSM 12555]|uniref:HNH endonuclease n=1 Tax=Clostridium acidisoli DSM 12555 TaxID=1121291 RepID=A0A1W1X236_9CLOT|nr:hypothetical protein [Clostridium acidisoli]SMC17471.1 hypothetical protein SAMN02745134_00340 [Clostridium acidisoli DSM 12555]